MEETWRYPSILTINQGKYGVVLEHSLSEDIRSPASLLVSTMVRFTNGIFLPSPPSRLRAEYEGGERSHSGTLAIGAILHDWSTFQVLVNASSG